MVSFPKSGHIRVCVYIAIYVCVRVCVCVCVYVYPLPTALYHCLLLICTMDVNTVNFVCYYVHAYVLYLCIHILFT